VRLAACADATAIRSTVQVATARNITPHRIHAAGSAIAAWLATAPTPLATPHAKSAAPAISTSQAPGIKARANLT